MAEVEFETILKELSSLKPPGVSGSRIKKLTEIAVKNVSNESVLVPILYSTCKAMPSSHKLGSLYVVDAIVRAYIEEAKKESQEINADAPEGTFAAGVFKITELIESLIDDALELSVSKSSNIKIEKLVDIWERAQTFSPELIKQIRDKHFASTTPPGTPPAKPAAPATSAKSEDSGSILSALASLAQKSNSNGSTPNPAPAQPDSSANNILSQLSAIAGGSQVASNAPPAAAQAPAAQAPGNNQQHIFNMLQQMQGAQAQQPPVAQERSNYHENNNGSGYTRRNRSRSPQRSHLPPQPQFGGQQNNFRSPPQQFNQQQQQYGGQNYGNQGGYGGNQQQQQYGNNNQFGGNNQYGNRQNQQQQQQQQQPQSNELNVEGNPHFRPRNVGFDSSLPQGSFKVLSRTLFIGGVPRNMDDSDLAHALRPYGEVQSVILNSERKHAFVKVYSRREAEQVITSFNKDNALPLRTRWGVGFGPRDCCNYQHGISVIPIQRLTDADRTWVVQAQWGGTGGQPLQSGMVIDEPDIEIGAGISSKAMSKKMPTNSARNGPKSNRPGEADDDYVKTTVLQNQGSMTHGGQPEFTTYNQSSVNPLQGLFNNGGGNQQFPPQNGFPNQPNQGQGQGQNPNLSSQLANFFQNNR